MKKLLILLSSTLFLAACAGENLDDKFDEKAQKVQELEENLHTEEVENKQLKSDLENIEEEIARVNRDTKDSNIDKYQHIVEDYSSSLSGELEALKTQIDTYHSSKHLSVEEVKKIDDNILDIIDTYNNDVEELKLQDALSRQHNKIELFNDNLTKNMNTLIDAFNEDNKDSINESIEKVKETTKFL